MSASDAVLVGNLVRDPELRFTPSGVAVATMTVACADRFQDKATQEWKDRDPLFMRVTAWRDLAEHAASLSQGDRVVIHGRLEQKEFLTKEGEKRTSVEVTASELAASLRFADVKVIRTARQAAPATTDEPWSSTPPAPAAQAPLSEAPPF